MGTANVFIVITSVVATLSVIGSLLVVLTFIIFPTMRKRLLMKLIAYISLADLISNLSYIPPTRPENGSILCSIQGFINLTCYPMSWLWTLALVYCLFHIAYYSRVPTNRHLHLFCWGIPLLLTLVSLGFTTLGRQSTFPEFEVCNYYGGNAAEIYHIIAYYGLLLVIFAVMIYLHNKIRMLEKASDPRIFVATFSIARISLNLYPMLLVVCWFPHAIVSSVEYFYTSTSSAYKETYFVTDMLKILHGLFTAIVFFSRSAESRRAWYFLVCRGTTKLDDKLMDANSSFSDGSELDGYREYSFYVSTDRTVSDNVGKTLSRHNTERIA